MTDWMEGGREREIRLQMGSERYQTPPKRQPKEPKRDLPRKKEKKSNSNGKMAETTKSRRRRRRRRRRKGAPAVWL